MFLLREFTFIVFHRPFKTGFIWRISTWQRQPTHLSCGGQAVSASGRSGSHSHPGGRAGPHTQP